MNKQKFGKLDKSYFLIKCSIIKGDLEPTIIFLTDGDPTVGETSTQRIISHMTEKNSGQKKAAIFSLAFGQYKRNILVFGLLFIITQVSCCWKRQLKKLIFKILIAG